MIRRTPTSGRAGGVVEVARGRDHRSWGILGGRVVADGLWILPEAWKTLHHRLEGAAASGPAFPTPPWTARAPPTGSTSLHPLRGPTTTRVG